MSPQIQLSISVSGLGQTISEVTTYQADGGTPREIIVPVGYAGSLTVRTDNNTGTVTGLPNGHGLVNGDLVDIYFPAGVQYKSAVGVAGADQVTIDNGVGDNLPVLNSAVIVSKRIAFSAPIDGDVSSVIAVKMHFDQQNEASPGHIYFADAANGEITELDLTPNVISLFRPLNGVANPYTGNPIVNGYVSNSSLVNPGKLQLLALFDSTP